MTTDKATREAGGSKGLATARLGQAVQLYSRTAVLDLVRGSSGYSPGIASLFAGYRCLYMFHVSTCLMSRPASPHRPVLALCTA